MDRRGRSHSADIVTVMESGAMDRIGKSPMDGLPSEVQLSWAGHPGEKPKGYLISTFGGRPPPQVWLQFCGQAGVVAFTATVIKERRKACNKGEAMGCVEIETVSEHGRDFENWNG